MNKKIEKERPELNLTPVKSPWFHLGIDFIGPISPPSFAGNRYILTAEGLCFVYLGSLITGILYCYLFS